MKFGDPKPGRRMPAYETWKGKFHNFTRIKVGAVEVHVFGYEESVVVALPETSVVLSVEQATTMCNAIDEVIKTKGT